MRLLLPALALALLMLAPPAAPASTAGGPDGADALRADLHDAARLQAVASKFPRGQGLGEAIVAATGVTPLAASSVSLEQALADLYAEAGIAAEPREPADLALAASIAPLVEAEAQAARLIREAFAGMTPEEREFALENVALLVTPSDGTTDGARAARVAEIAARVDTAKLAEAAAVVAFALDHFVAPPMASSWVDPSGTIEVGSTSDDAYCAERMLIVDLGGNDVYDCSPAAYGPGSTLPLPMSVILDLGGNDRYQTTSLFGVDPASAWGQGVGIGGLGIIVDRWGDDVYTTTVIDQGAACPMEDWMIGNMQAVYAQAVGALGVGAIADLSGNDRYLVVNTDQLTLPCHFGWAYTFAQGVGLTNGIGLLADDTGDDVYFTTTTSVGKYDNTAADYSKAAAAGGLGVLVDKEGSDRYIAEADGYLTQGAAKGAFAYVFSQASVAATRKQIAPVAPVAFDLGIAPPRLPSPCPAADGRAGTPEGKESSSCIGFGVALLVDVLGDDTFSAITRGDDLGLGCGNGLWSVVSAQGAAATWGLALLVNLDVEGRDSFDLAPSAYGSNCGYPGVRAHAYGQGYGGPVLWNFWDVPTASPTRPLAIGILASLGVPEEMCPGNTTLGALDALLDQSLTGSATSLGDSCRKLHGSLPHLAASPDDYHAHAIAVNPQGEADAEAWVQGASGSSTTLQSYFNGGTYTALGVGVHADVGGDDTYDAQTDVKAPLPTTIVYAQSATDGAIAALADVGGADRYTAAARVNGVSVPSLTRVQGWAGAGPGLGVPAMCVSTPIVFACTNPVNLLGTGLAVFTEVFGEDSYSEAPERVVGATACQANGALLGTWPIGLPLGTIWWGHLVSSPCAGPIDMGDGIVVGLDWASDVS